MVVKKKSTKGSSAESRKTAGKVAKTAKKPSKIVKKTTIKKVSKAVKKATPKKPSFKKATTKKTTAAKTRVVKKTSNRGRPKKEFKLKHKRTVGQKIVMHEIPKTHKIKNSSNRDRSILYLFIFSIILFMFSLGVSFFKKNQVQELKNIENVIETTPTQIEEVITEGAATISEIGAGLEKFYVAINSKNFTEAREQLDSYLKNTSTIKTYFSSKRLTRFLDNLTDGKIHINNIQEETINDYTTKITYDISYTLLDGNKFEEQRTVSMVKRDESEGKIAAIKCETKGCSRMPFFNPTKYNIH